jgi:GMP synthase-like glutamine amidotransferase
MRVAIHTYAPDRAAPLQAWFPEATVHNRYLGDPAATSFDLLILSGGPMSADTASQRQYPFLKEDARILQTLKSEGDGPFVLGICLGAQLMTFALGGIVEEGDSLLAGWNELRRVANHPAFEGLPALLQCEIHKNHITVLPPKARTLVSSEVDKIEAFSVGTRFIGTGYHPEITSSDMAFITQKYGVNFATLSKTQLTSTDAHEASRKFFDNIRSIV